MSVFILKILELFSLILQFIHYPTILKGNPDHFLLVNTLRYFKQKHSISVGLRILVEQDVFDFNSLQYSHEPGLGSRQFFFRLRLLTFFSSGSGSGS